MTNSVKGEIQFESGGKTYTFKLGMNAQAVIEERTGMTMAKFFKEDRLEDLGAREVRLIFWAALHRQHPEMTEETAGDIIDEIGADEVAELLVRGVKAASGQDVQKNKSAGVASRPQKQAKAPIGMDS